jgi:hypothetical protein
MAKYFEKRARAEAEPFVSKIPERMKFHRDNLEREYERDRMRNRKLKRKKR